MPLIRCQDSRDNVHINKYCDVASNITRAGLAWAHIFHMENRRICPFRTEISPFTYANYVRKQIYVENGEDTCIVIGRPESTERERMFILKYETRLILKLNYSATTLVRFQLRAPVGKDSRERKYICL